jgi:hypothetical protein
MLLSNRRCLIFYTFVVFLSLVLLDVWLLSHAGICAEKKRYVIRLKGKALADYPEFYDYAAKKRRQVSSGLKKVSLKSSDAGLADSLPDTLSSELTLMRRQQNNLKQKISSLMISEASSGKVSLKADVSGTALTDAEFIRENSILSNSIVVNADESIIQKLSGLEEVDEIYEDKRVKFFLDESVPLINADKVRAYTDSNGLSITGKGIRVAVIDTGVDYTHDALGKGFGTGFKVVSGYDYVNYDGDPRDDNGHGTHVAGIIAANGSTVSGVAPEASIIALKVLDRYGSGYSSDVVSALEDSINMGAHVANISLGTMDDKALTEAALKAITQGMLVCAAAGNEGPTPYTINSPGDGEAVLCVAATNKSNDMWYASSVGPTSAGLLKPDIAAPGESIYSTYRYNGYRYMSGTSMATPHVTGAVALMLQFDPTLTPGQIKQRFTDNAVNLGFSHYRQGYGLLDVRAALLNGGVALPPEIEITAPISADDKSDLYPSRYMIKWTDKDDDSSASISLYYDTDNTGFDGQLISQGISEDSSDNYYIWDTTSITEGKYYIYAVISDGINSEVKKYSTGMVNVLHSPGITMIEPASSGVIVEDRVNVFWQDFDDDDNAVIEIYYDDNKSGLDGTLIAGNIQEDEDSNFISVDVTSFERGKFFYFYAKISDSKTESYSYSPGYFIRDSAPSAAFESLSAGLYLVKNDQAELKISLSDPEEFPQVNIYYDTDNSGNDGTLIVGGLTYTADSPADGGIISYTWDMSDIQAGQYYVYIRVSDGVNDPVFLYSEAVFLKNLPPEFSFNVLAGAGDTASDEYEITFTLADNDSDAYGRIYYDNDSSNGNGIFIRNIDESMTSFKWDVSNVASGSYWLYSEVMDEYNEMERVYTQNPLVIDHRPGISFVYPQTPPVIADSVLPVQFTVNDESAVTVIFGLSQNPDYTGITYLPAVHNAEPGVLQDISISLGALERGKYYIYCKVIDAAQNEIEELYSLPVFIEINGSVKNVRAYNLGPSSLDISFDSDLNLVSTVTVIPYIVETASAQLIFGTTVELSAPVVVNNKYVYSVSNLVFPTGDFSKKGIKYKITRSNNNVSEIFPAKGYSEVVLPSAQPSDSNISKVEANNYTDSAGFVFIKVKNMPELSIRSNSLGANNTVELPLSGFYDSSMQEYIPKSGDIIQIEICGSNGKAYYEVTLGETNEVISFNVNQLPGDFYFRLQYNAGWNLLHVPIIPDPAVSSKDILEKTGAYFIARWNSEYQQYESTLMDEGVIMGQTFEIKPGTGFFLKAPIAGEVELKGKYSAEISTIQLFRGFSLFGFSYGYDQFLDKEAQTSIESVLSDSSETLGVYRWNNSASAYDYRIKAEDNVYLGTDFNPSYTEGLFIKSKSSNYIIDYKD